MIISYLNSPSLVVQRVKHLPTMWETQVQSMGQGDLLEKGMATHSSSLAATPDSPKELYKNDLHDQDNHDGMIAHLEPDILECEVKLALESITTNRASRGDGIPVELFQILKDDAVKVLHSICQQIGKLSSDHRTGKGQFSFQSQRKAMPKNAQTTAQLHSSHMLVK